MLLQVVPESLLASVLVLELVSELVSFPMSYEAVLVLCRKSMVLLQPVLASAVFLVAVSLQAPSPFLAPSV